MAQTGSSPIPQSLTPIALKIRKKNSIGRNDWLKSSKKDKIKIKEMKNKSRNLLKKVELWNK